ncbi:hypothetical protein RRG08_051346 [Elysia crispata]|uniref:Uncharacterized protein n=1 Tax=Elysia crispata TaxID=231223 RepID=A0AAE1EAN8_9GAST|nr:hypothetical protein RRG08_051346 [Elysia crispata]
MSCHCSVRSVNYGAHADATMAALVRGAMVRWNVNSCLKVTSNILEDRRVCALGSEYNKLKCLTALPYEMSTIALRDDPALHQTNRDNDTIESRDMTRDRALLGERGYHA